MSLHRLMLDTNILSHIVREPLGAVSRKIEQRGIDRVCTSILVAGELRYGAAKSRSERLRARVDVVLSGLEVVALAAPVDAIYAQVRDSLMKAGTPIGPVNMFIAAHALSLDLALVTDNVREFSRVPGLTVENWLD